MGTPGDGDVSQPGPGLRGQSRTGSDMAPVVRCRSQGRSCPGGVAPLGMVEHRRDGCAGVGGDGGGQPLVRRARPVGPLFTIGPGPSDHLLRTLKKLAAGGARLVRRRAGHDRARHRNPDRQAAGDRAGPARRGRRRRLLRSRNLPVQRGQVVLQLLHPGSGRFLTLLQQREQLLFHPCLLDAVDADAPGPTPVPPADLPDYRKLKRLVIRSLKPNHTLRRSSQIKDRSSTATPLTHCP